MKGTLFICTTHLPPDYNFGGVVYSSLGLIKTLSAELRTFRVVAFACSREPKRVRAFMKAAVPNCEFIVEESHFFHRDGVIGLLGAFYIFRMVVNSTVVICNGIFTVPTTLSLLLAWLLRRKLFVFVRGGLDDIRVSNSGTLKKQIYMRLLRHVVKRKFVVLCATSESEVDVVRKSLSIPSDRVLLCPNGLNSKIPPKDRFDSDKLNVVFFSRISREKGLDKLSGLLDEEWFKEHCDLQVYGPGGVREIELLRQADLLKCYLGPKYGIDKLKVIQAADIMVLPSYSENFGNVVLEFLSAGVPVVTTDATYWVKYRNQAPFLRVADSTKFSFQAELKKLAVEMKSEDVRRRYSRLAVQFASSEFDWPKTCATLIAAVDASLS